jgi:hypothetical protein
MTEKTGTSGRVMDVARVGPIHGIEEDDDGADDHSDQPGRRGEGHEPEREEWIFERR